MLSIIRVASKKVSEQIFGLHKVTKVNNVFFQQTAFLYRKSKAYAMPPRPKPFNYKTTKFNIFHEYFDNTFDRFDENSLIIAVEGPIAVGKHKFCQELADELDMVYLPPLTFDDMYKKGPYGIDIRQFDHELPVNLQSHDLTKFLKNPHHVNTAVFQIHYYKLKFERYCDAVIHLLSTGQGVVIQRTPYSDFVFVQAMVNAGYLSKAMGTYHREMRERNLNLVGKPHVIIYLDIDAEQSLENIKKRNNPLEVNSEVLTLDYLKDIEVTYKERFLKPMDRHSHVLSYDWSAGIKTEHLVDELETLDFSMDHKNTEWNEKNDYWLHRRYMLCPFRRNDLQYQIYLDKDVDELKISGEEHELSYIFESETPGIMYEAGYDPKLDGCTLFKTKSYPPDVQWRNEQSYKAERNSILNKIS